MIQMVNIILSFLMLVTIISSIIIFLGYYTYLKIVKKSKRTLREEINYLIKNNVIKEGYYESLNKEEFIVQTKDKLSLKGILIKTNEASRGTIIFSHGISCTHGMMIKHVDLFLKNKFNVVLFDQRRHGNSEGKFSSYGYYEKEDLSLFVNYVKNEFKEDKFIGVIGESMGASTALQMLGINNSVDFIIAESAFSDLEKVLKINLKEKYKVPYFIFGKLASLFSYLKHGFAFKDIKPIEVIKNNDTPILFIHGTEDKTAPYNMSIEMAQVSKNSRLHLIKGAPHKINCDVDHSREDYEKVIIDFINDVVNFKKSFIRN